MKITGKKLQQAKKRARQLIQLRNKNSKILANDLKKDFLSISVGISKTKDFDKISDFGIYLDKFSKKVEKTLIKNFRSNLNERSEYLKSSKVTDIKMSTIKYKLDERYRKSVGSKVKGITETTRESLERVIRDNRELPYSEIAEKIAEKIETMSLARAITIAKTEINKTSNEVDNDIALETLAKNKTWLHTGRGKTDRADHLALDGVTIPIEDKFTMGNGELADYPLDPSLSAENSINCACMVVFDIY